MKLIIINIVNFAAQTALSSSRLIEREGGKSGHPREA
jgi:hypothetical protein